MFRPTNHNSNQQVICKFYQNGNCKHGEKCWNIHPSSTGFGSASNAFVGGSSGSSGTSFNKIGSGGMKNDFTEFVNQVAKEMQVWEEKKMWQLSCLAPLVHHPPLTGFVDTSPEELRLEAYEARKGNNFALYESNLKQKMDFHMQLRQSLKNKSPEAIEALKEVFYKGSPPTNNTQKSVFSANPNSAFGGSSTPSKPSIFGGFGGSQNTSSFGAASAPAGGIFGSKTQPASVFGATPSFGSLNANKGFGNSSNPGFGNVSSSNTFGGNSSSIFGSAPVNQPSSGSLFAASQPSTNSNVFGSAAFSATPSASVFGAPKPFGAVSSSTASSIGVFGAPQQSSGVSGNLPQTSSSGTNFGAKSEPNAIFGANPSMAGNTFGSKFTLTQFSNNSGNIASQSGTSNIFQKAVLPSSSSTTFGTSSLLPTPSVFGQPVASTTTNQSMNSGNIFQSASVFSTTPSQNSSLASVFGATPPVASTQSAAPVTSTSSVVETSIYTPLHLLSLEDKVEFERDVFIRIPLVPPPRELCF